LWKKLVSYVVLERDKVNLITLTQQPQQQLRFLFFKWRKLTALSNLSSHPKLDSLEPQFKVRKQ